MTIHFRHRQATVIAGASYIGVWYTWTTQSSFRARKQVALVVRYRLL